MSQTVNGDFYHPGAYLSTREDDSFEMMAGRLINRKEDAVTGDKDNLRKKGGLITGGQSQQ